MIANKVPSWITAMNEVQCSGFSLEINPISFPASCLDLNTYHAIVSYMCPIQQIFVKLLCIVLRFFLILLGPRMREKMFLTSTITCQMEKEKYIRNFSRYNL